MIVDLRHEQKAGGPDPKCGRRDQSGRLVMRDPKTITGICVHQTAVVFGASSSAVLAAKGDRNLARHRRALGVHAHVTAFQDGTGAIAYPLAAYVFHGNGLNAESVGLEIEGAYSGAKSIGEVPDGAVAAARELLERILDEGRKAGMPLRYIWAHRQSSPSRRGDPGAELWRRVVLEYAVPVLGLEMQPTRTWGEGRPIPREWDPSQPGAY